MPERPLVIGTRGSLLARWQAGHVQAGLEAADRDLVVRQQVITTQGDRELDKPLSQIGGKGLFTSELERALCDGAIDVAVHSLKDVPTADPEGLVLGAILPRADWHDAWISRLGLLALPAGARVGTSSLRRVVQLRRLRPDLQIQDLRGNVDTRLRKLDEGQVDAIVLAAAGLTRLGRGDRIRERLPFLPAAGQGAIVVQCRADDRESRRRLGVLHDEATAVAVGAEREWLMTMEGGCQVPMGALALLDGEQVVLRAFAADPDGDGYLEAADSAALPEVAGLGVRLAHRLLDAGAAGWCVPQLGRDPTVA